jgi:endonuclease YncB( thermonuclease family)
MLILYSRWNGISVAVFLCLIVFAQHVKSGAQFDAGIEWLCPAQQSLTPVRIHEIIDGDTVVLASGQHLRIIGINTPELNFGKHGRSAKPQPYAKKARQFLNRRVKNSKQIYMSLGKEQKDRYGRILAHLYSDPHSDLRTGFQGARYNIAAQMIRRGLGFYIAIPPNLGQSACLKQVESQARVEQLGLWRDFTAVNPENESHFKSGFQLVSGRIVKVSKVKSGWWLEFNGPLVLRINAENAAYFDAQTLQSYVDDSVMVRGWVIDRGSKYEHHSKGYKRWLMNLAHPLSIDGV